MARFAHPHGSNIKVFCLSIAPSLAGAFEMSGLFDVFSDDEIDSISAAPTGTVDLTGTSGEGDAAPSTPDVPLGSGSTVQPLGTGDVVTPCKRKSAASKLPPRAVKKRIQVAPRASNVLTAQSVPSGSAKDLKCLFLDRGTGLKSTTPKLLACAIPLWPLYDYTKDGVGGCRTSEPFLVIGWSEHWLTACFEQIHGAGSSRLVLPQFLKEIRSEFKLAVTKARSALSRRPNQPKGGDDEDADSDEASSIEDRGEDDRVSRRLNLKRVPTINIDLHGCIVVVLNSIRPLVLRLDDAGMKYLTGPFLTKLRAVATEKPVAATGGQCALAAFHIPVSLTPNITGKVVWSVVADGWNLVCKKPRRELVAWTDGCGGSLKVCATLRDADRIAAKLVAYGRAIRAWNAVDGSTRSRIEIPAACDGVP